MTKAYRTVSADEIFAQFSPERQKKINARAAKLIEGEVALRDLRQAKRMTQEQVARNLGGRQVHISRLEKRADMKLSTLREYVGAIGGTLELVVAFPKGQRVKLAKLGTALPVSAAPRKRRLAAAKKRSAKSTLRD